MDTKVVEWMNQSDYDIDTAKYMFAGGRYSYTVFMCHLSIEKALKGLYQHKLGNTAPKTHNLIYLTNEIGVRPDKTISKILVKLNEANIATRYPESLELIQKNYTVEMVKIILSESEELLEWIKKQF